MNNNIRKLASIMLIEHYEREKKNRHLKICTRPATENGKKYIQKKSKE